METVNPATERRIAILDEDTLSSLADKLKLLKKAQPLWSARPLAQRRKILQDFADLLIQEKKVLASVLSEESGKPIQQAKGEIKGAFDRTQWLVDHAGQYLSDEIMTDRGGLKEVISYEPLGVIGNISAWNYPYLIGVNVFIPALLAGNAVLYKPSEFAVHTGLEIERLLLKAGLPEGIFKVAIGAAELGDAMLDLPLDGYFFTGSYRTGKYIYERVAPKMVPCQLELGGKDPIYVMDDIQDIVSLAEATADGAFYNNGQSCCAVERIYVHKNVYNAYVDAFVSQVRAWKVGDPDEEGVYFGPLTRKEQLVVLEQQVEDAVAKGAQLLTGGKRMNRRGYYFEPTVLVHVDHSMSVMRDESFGPIIGIMSVNDDDEALALMQDTEYGLTAGVYSHSKERAEGVLKKLNVGSAYWNCCDRVSAALPWSGRGHSGIGATLSHIGMRAFTKPKGWHLKGLY